MRSAHTYGVCLIDVEKSLILLAYSDNGREIANVALWGVYEGVGRWRGYMRVWDGGEGV